MSKFKFNILTGTDAQTKYDNIATKDPFTLYLLQDLGIGYFNGKKIINADNTSISIETSNTIDSETPNKIPTTQAIIDYVDNAIQDKVPYEFDGVAGSGSDISSGGTESNTNTSSSSGNPLDFTPLSGTNCVQVGKWVNGKPIYRYKQNYQFSKSNPTRSWTWTSDLPDSIKTSAANGFVLQNLSMCWRNRTTDRGWEGSIPVTDLDDCKVLILGDKVTITTTNLEDYDRETFCVMFDFVA